MITDQMHFLAFKHSECMLWEEWPPLVSHLEIPNSTVVKHEGLPYVSDSLILKDAILPLLNHLNTY